jgi:hypothetical protein
MSVVFLLVRAAAASAQLMVANEDTFGVPFGDPPALVVEAPGVLENDTLDGSPAWQGGVSVEILPVSDVSHGTLVLHADGSFAYTPNAGFSGSDSFVYRAVAGKTTSQATVTLTACTGGPEFFSCWQEASYLGKLAELGYQTFKESFEDDAVWGSVRSTVSVTNSAPEITHRGITWTSNHPATNPITTGQGAARTGLWGVYDPDHGSATGTAMECDMDNPPPTCLFHDGFSGIRTAGEGALHGAGGYITGITGANVAIVLDDTRQTTMGKLPDSADHYFFGVIDASASGFNQFEFREIDGKVGQERLIFGDDFVFATAPTAKAYHISALNGSDTMGDGSLPRPWQTLTHALSQIDGTLVPATLMITADTYPEDLVVNKVPGLYHLAGGWNEAFLIGTGVTVIDGSLVIAGASVIVSNLLIQ